MRRPGFAALWLASLAAMLRDKGAALLLLGAPVLYGFFYPWFYAPQVVQRVPVALVVQDASGLSCHFQKTTARNIRSRLHWWIAARCTGPSCSP